MSFVFPSLDFLFQLLNASAKLRLDSSLDLGIYLLEDLFGKLHCSRL